MKLFHKLGVAAMALAMGIGSPQTADAAPKDKKDGVLLDHVMLEANPFELIPCIKVRKNLFNQSRSDASITIEIRLTYTSRDTEIEKVFVVPLQALQLTTHHPQPQGKWRLAETVLDVSDAPPDEGTAFTGTVTLLDDDCVATRTYPLSFVR